MTSSRPYQPENGLALLYAFLVKLHAEDPNPYCAMHVGDLLWRLFMHNFANPTENVRLWLDEHDNLIGFAWFYPPNAVEMVITPSLRNTGRLEAAMTAWAIERSQIAEQPATYLITDAQIEDESRVACITNLGFQQQTNHFVLLVRDLTEMSLAFPLASGYHIHAVTNPDQFEARVNLHRSVWHPSRVTLDAYQRMRGIPGYDPELDLVVEAADGTLAAYCICWLDQANYLGLFEPVGTEQAFRQQGLGKAVIGEGLRRLYARGARTALVATYGTNQAAVRLYESAGFQVRYHSYDFRKEIG